MIYETPLALVNQMVLAYYIANGAEMEWVSASVSDTVREKLEILKQWQSAPRSE